jgi:predicted nucleic acid-binding protein
LSWAYGNGHAGGWANRSNSRSEQIYTESNEHILKHIFALLDDALARRVAIAKGIAINGTLGLLLNAKRAGYLTRVGPSLDKLQELGFRLARQTQDDVLKLAGEL